MRDVVLTGFCELPQTTALRLLGASKGAPIRRRALSSAARYLVEQLAARGVNDVLVHDDPSARLAAATLGAHAFCYGSRVVLGPTVGTPLGPTFDDAVRHELIHVGQVHQGTLTGAFASHAVLEREAEVLSAAKHPSLNALHGAAPSEAYGLWWFLPLGAALYVLLRPGVANAPGPSSPTYPSVSELQVAGEAFALFAVPYAGLSLGGRLGLGFYSSSAIGGASGMITLRGVQDAARGQVSAPEVYVFDAVTGGAVGIIVPGGIRLIGSGTTRTLDWLATHGMRRSDLAVTRLLVERVARGPMTAAEVADMLRARNVSGRVADWWLNRRGLIVLYRGQGETVTRILSPLAREHGVAASEAMVARMRAAGLTDAEIAGYTARWHTTPVPDFLAPPGLANQPLGAAGIATSRIPGVSANFANDGVVYIIRLPRGGAIKVPPWGLAVENEWVVLNEIPAEGVIGMMRAARVPALEVNALGQLIPAR